MDDTSARERRECARRRCRSVTHARGGRYETVRRFAPRYFEGASPPAAFRAAACSSMKACFPGHLFEGLAVGVGGFRVALHLHVASREQRPVVAGAVVAVEPLLQTLRRHFDRRRTAAFGTAFAAPAGGMAPAGGIPPAGGIDRRAPSPGRHRARRVTRLDPRRHGEKESHARETPTAAAARPDDSEYPLPIECHPALFPGQRSQRQPM